MTKPPLVEIRPVPDSVPNKFRDGARKRNELQGLGVNLVQVLLAPVPGNQVLVFNTPRQVPVQLRLA